MVFIWFLGYKGLTKGGLDGIMQGFYKARGEGLRFGQAR